MLVCPAHFVGHETTAGKEWQDGEHDTSAAGNKLVAGNGGDSVPEYFDDVDGGEADGGTVTVVQGANNNNGTSSDATDDYYQAMIGDISVSSALNNIVIFSNTGLGGDTFTELGHQMKLSAVSGDGGVQRGITPLTAGDGGDINVTRGRIEGNVNLTASASGTGATAADGEVFVDAQTGTGTRSEVLLGHSNESILTTGRSGYGQEYQSETYDGVDSSTGDAASSTLTVLAALQELAADTLPNSNSADTATLTNIDKRDTIRLIKNVVAGLKTAQQYTDRMTADEAQNLAAALSEAEAALTDIGTAELAATRSDVSETAIADTYGVVQSAAARAAAALVLALDGSTTAGTTTSGQSYAANAGLRDADSRAGTTDIYANLFGDHADGGDIRIDENADGTAVDAARIIGNVTLTGNSTAGVVRTEAKTGTGKTQVELGHRLAALHNTGEGGGETDGGTPDGGDVGDGGSISLGGNVSGDVLLTANELVVTASGLESSTHLGHSMTTENYAGMSDIFNNGMGNGGIISSSQTVGGATTLRANILADAVGAANSRLAVSGSDSELRLGHIQSHLNESDDDGKVAGPGDSKEYNRAGDISVAQASSGDVTIDLNLDGDANSRADLIIDASADSSNKVRIMHEASQYAFSGQAGHGYDGDGQTVTASQTIQGNLNTSGLEDLQVTSAGGEMHIGHNGKNEAISGVVNPSTGGDYGERVDADQTVTGEIDLSAPRSVTIELTGGTTGMNVGHIATQIAKSADDGGDFDTEEGYRDGSNNLLVADVDADQTVSGALSITSGEIKLALNGSAELHYGHVVRHETATDHNTGSTPGHIEANSSVSGNMAMTTAAASAPADSSSNIDSTTGAKQGSITFDASNDTLQFGHEASTNTGHDEANDPNGSVDSYQTIYSDITVTTEDDLIMTAASSAEGLIGHQISEENQNMGTSAGKGHENTYLDANGDVQVSDASQRVIGDIIVNTGDSLSMKAGGSDTLRIGHSSPGANYAQLGVSDQQLTGDITVKVGTVKDGSADGAVVGDGNAADNDDALIEAASGGVAAIGHDMTNSADNEVQIAKGDIWVEVGADLHVKGGKIGHDDYEFADQTVDKDTSFDLTVAKAAALAARNASAADTDLASGTGVGTIRNRIQGNTTIGAAQNSPNEDSTLQADAMLFDGSAQQVKINSGYGGKGDADVDGELRFFMPAQQNLTIVSTVKFNDHVSGDNIEDRTDLADTILSADGTDHEHYFTTMSDTADYNDATIGLGNFGFYFESPPSSGSGEVQVPFVPPAFSGALDIVFDSRTGTYGVVNIGSLEGNVVVGTNSFEALCEESGMANCGQIGQRFANSGSGRSGASGVNGYGSGFGSLFVGYYFDEETGEWRRIEEREGEQEEQANGPAQPTNQVAAAQPTGPVRILTARSVRLEQTIVNAGVVQEEDIVVNNSSPRRPVVIGSNVEQPAPRGTVRIQSAATERTTVGSSDRGLVSQQVDAQISVEAGYGQMVSNRFDQKAFLRQLGYQNAMSSTSSYGLFATGGS